MDNDGDGLVDCADPQCQVAYTCVDADPPGWNGHFYVHETTFTAPAAAPCAADLTPFTDFEDPAGAAQCDACTCGAPQGASCSPPPIQCSGNSTNCGGNPQDWTSALKDGACDKPTNLAGNAFFLSCKLTGTSAVTAPGQCTPSASDFSNKGSWQQRIDVCGTDKAGGGCGAGKVCVPKASGASVNESVCVRHDGLMACPAGYAQSVQGYGSASDSRACSACSCGGPGTTCSAGSYTFYDLDACATAGQSDNPVTIGSTACSNVSTLLDQGSWSVQASLPVPSGSCPASGGAPVGSVQPSQPVTYCCK